MYSQGSDKVREIIEKGKVEGGASFDASYSDMFLQILAYASGEDVEIREEEVEDNEGFFTAVQNMGKEAIEPVLISGNFMNISPLNSLRGLCSTDHIKILPVGLNLENCEGLSEEMCRDPAILKVAMINLSGKQFRDSLSLASSWTGWMAQSFPKDHMDDLQFSALHSLDLSYTEIFVDPLAFVLCPLLKRLNLDGCNITTTIYEEPRKGTVEEEEEEEGEGEGEPWDVRGSMFLGLNSLKVLSLAENPLPDVAALQGIRVLATLTSLNLTGCILREKNHLSREATEEALKLVGPTLVTIDGQPVAQSSADLTLFPIGRIDNDDIATGFTTDLDAADREFTQALRGEKDVTVVA